MKKLFNFLILFIICQLSCEEDGFCDKDSQLCSAQIESKRYILYDVNPPEGFNLRRDVYLRMAIFVHNLRYLSELRTKQWNLVLPPWPRLYHWKTKNIYQQQLAWSHFFDIDSLKKFAPVIEMHEFFKETKTRTIDNVYVLKNFEYMFKTLKFEEKLEIGETCADLYHFYDYTNLTSTNPIQCLYYHGPINNLVTILQNTTAKHVLFHHAEIALHDMYGGALYWRGRRSMRFNKELYQVANKFRKLFLNSDDVKDNTLLPQDWTLEKEKREIKGGPYLCAHLRRGDFARSRPNDVPDIESAASQIVQLLKQENLHVAFISTDADLLEYKQLKSILTNKNYTVIKFLPNDEQRIQFKDGGVAVIDQIICSCAKYFIGTHESTFTYRIQEEREIRGFPIEKTFNRFCHESKRNCSKPSIWKIVY